MLQESPQYLTAFFDGLLPEPRLTVSEWADLNRELSSAAAAEPGAYRTSRTPYLREVMDNLSARSIVEDITVMKGAQLGFTDAGNNWLGYVMDNAPGPFMLVMPTDKTLKKNITGRVDHMIKTTKILQRKVMSVGNKRSGNTTFEKHFPGGIFYGSSAQSASDLSSVPVRYLMLDEIDRYPKDIKAEGDPVEIAKARTSTFSTKKKIYKVSTPTVTDASAIEREYKKGDQRKYFVPCPHCNHYQDLVFENLRYSPGDLSTTVYVCSGCGFNIEERYKTQMLAAGEWRATAPENTSPTRVSYHINSLYSPLGWLSWAAIVQQYLDAEGDSQKLKTFWNTVLGLTWKEDTDRPSWERLLARAGGYDRNKISNEVVFITAGVDVQGNRFELEIVGWCRDKRSYSIDYRMIPADTTILSEFERVLDPIVNEKWERPDGLIVPLRTMCIDTGYNTAAVYVYCRKYQGFLTKVVPIKGRPDLQNIITPPKPVDTNKYGDKMVGLKVWPVGVNIVKEEVYGFLNLEISKETGEIPHGYCYFPKYGDDYFKGLTAEEYKPVVLGGIVKKVWQKKYKRNEQLDCRVYARAAAAIHGYDYFTPEQFDLIVDSYRPAVIKPEPPKKNNTDIWGDVGEDSWG